MRRLFAIFLFSAVALLGSCSLFSVDDKDFGDQIYYSSLYGRWVFSANGYTWIELTEAGYYYAGSTSAVTDFGKWSKTDSKQFTLEGLGVMDVTSCTETDSDDDGESDKFYLKFDFTFDDDATNPYYVEASMAAEMEDNDYEQLDDLCATWELLSIISDGSCGCTCVGCDCSIDKVCNVYGCNCLCHEDRWQIKYIYFTASGNSTSNDENRGYFHLIYNNETVQLFTRWEWGDLTTTYPEDKQIISFYDSSQGAWDESSLWINSLDDDYLTLQYKDNDSGVTYTLSFELKGSGQLF